MKIEFGKHKGKDVAKVPAPYLLWFYEQAWSKDSQHAALRYYVQCNLRDLQDKVAAIQAIKRNNSLTTSKRIRNSLAAKVEDELTPADEPAPLPPDQETPVSVTYVSDWVGICHEESVKVPRCDRQCKFCYRDR